MYGAESNVDNASTLVQIMVNLICHSGSTVYELSSGAFSLRLSTGSLIYLELVGDDGDISLAQDRRC
jgi:hypothetical protein